MLRARFLKVSPAWRRVRGFPPPPHGFSPAAGSPACGLRSPSENARSSPRISARAIPDTSALPASPSTSRGSSSPPATAVLGRPHRGSPARATSEPRNFSPDEKKQLKKNDLLSATPPRDGHSRLPLASPTRPRLHRDATRPDSSRDFSSG